ncbi:MAG TPA: GatB/YqeY domain-containing protein [Verrucomicrobiae bacterium]|nr:GatB/YqeY domain-containing protein [Verrucomicrobiae bacterium]
MSLKERIDSDLKAAMLGGDKTLATTLRGLKSAILYVEVAEGKREQGLADQEIVGVLRKEAKKRQESAELFDRGGNQEKAVAERHELVVIENYLPAQLSDEEIGKLVDRAIDDVGAATSQDMGRIIGRVKELSKGDADGGRIAAAVKQRISG